MTTPALAHYVRRGLGQVALEAMLEVMGQQRIETFLQGSGPVLDLRAPSEFAQGHIPGAINLPLFSDAERAAVGTAYKQQGRRQAVSLGFELVGPRLAGLGERLTKHSQAAQGAPLRLHCWRGGMRSQSVAWLAQQLDLPVLLLEGGYKRFRRWVLEQLEQLALILVLEVFQQQLEVLQLLILFLGFVFLRFCFGPFAFWPDVAR